jgi:signal transduction histidine kinase
MTPMQAAAAAPSQARPGWRFSWLVDAVPAVFIVVLAAVINVDRGDLEHGGPGSALLGAAIALPLLWRRRYPFVIFCVVALLAIGIANVLPYPCIAAALIAAYSVAAYEPRWWLSLAAVAAVAIIVAIVFPGPLPQTPAALAPFVLLIVPWLAGNGIRLRQERVETVESRARTLERERDDAERALRDERTRIARELHDVVAHSVVVMVVQAGAARQLVRSKPDRATEALLAVEESGREALGELRHVLGLLTNDGETPLIPQLGLASLPALVERIKNAGLPVTLRIDGAPRHLPPGIDIASYRIIQEALTNALKHSGGAPTEVVVTYDENEIRLAIVDDGAAATADPAGPANGSGQGLVSMRERAALYGGSLDAGPRPGGGYAVKARLPLAST